MQNTEQPYLFTEFQAAQPLARTGESELSTSRILLHSLLLVCTAVTTALTGAALAVGGQVGDSIIDMLVAPTLAVVRE
ncbi:MAG TPA: hypothetical protein VKN18_27090, partial [Blastocatellia bacterium]|nr:hypothetical protein [Blastocatellia bacterium]